MISNMFENVWNVFWRNMFTSNCCKGEKLVSLCWILRCFERKNWKLETCKQNIPYVFFVPEQNRTGPGVFGVVTLLFVVFTGESCWESCWFLTSGRVCTMTLMTRNLHPLTPKAVCNVFCLKENGRSLGTLPTWNAKKESIIIWALHFLNFNFNVSNVGIFGTTQREQKQKTFWCS